LNVWVAPPPLGVKLIAIDCVAGDTYAGLRVLDDGLGTVIWTVAVAR
jgi:hypothetical protein